VRFDKSVKTLLVLLFFCFGPVLLLGADEGDRVLVYYFENLSKENGYEELSYDIPLFIYSRLRAGGRSSKVMVIDREGLDLRKKESSVDLWKTAALVNIARKRGIDQVLYGAFYVFNGKPVIAGKVLYAKSGLVLDVTENEADYFERIGETERKTVQELMSGGNDKVKRDYSPPFARTFGSAVVQKKRSLSVAVGPLFPLGRWGDIFPPGLFGDLSFVFFPKLNTLPLGLGLNSSYSLLSREPGAFAQSKIMAFSLGATLQYKILMKKLNKSVVFDVSSGMAMSVLYTNTETYPSFDPYVKAGVTLLFSTRRKASVSLKGGIYSINYRTVPIDSLYLQLGFWGG
jgi:hypothetical protein